MTAFKEFSQSKVQSFLKRLDREKVHHGFKTASTRILGQNLSFAPKWMRVECEDYSEMPHQKSIFLVSDDNIIPLVYTPDPLNNVFDGIDLDLDEDTVIDYLSLYFLSFLKNGERLKPVFHTDDIQWQDDLSPMLRKSLELDFSKYPRIQVLKDKLAVEFLGLFHQSIMSVTCLVSPDGAVQITDRTVIMDDLPVQ